MIKFTTRFLGLLFLLMLFLYEKSPKSHAPQTKIKIPFCCLKKKEKMNSICQKLGFDKI